MAGPDSTPWVAIAHTSVAPCSMRISAAATIVPRGVDHVVDDDAVPPVDVADDLRAPRPTLAMPFGRRL